ncbi:MAG: hypothetical protein FWF50_00140 [Defluviitaleaceae bacterium]|nr:hypothetical protein [Defluviitaleaceae bacterium]
MTLPDILILIAIIVGVVGVGLYFFTRWASRKVGEQQRMMQSMNQSITIYVIDKKKDKLTNANLPKAILEQMPKRANLMKMHLVKVKTGPQIMTMIADKHVWNALPMKKNIKVEVSGIYITSMQGLKSKKELKEAEKAKKEKAK